MRIDLRFPSFFYQQRLNAVGIPMLCGVLLFLLLPKFFLPIAALSSLFLIGFCFVQKGEKGKILLCAAIGISLSLILCGITSLREARAESLFESAFSARGKVVSVSEESFDLSLSRFNGKISRSRIRCEGENDFRMGDRLWIEGEILSELSDSDRQDGIFLRCETKKAKIVGKDPLFSFVGSIRQSISDSFGEGRVASFLNAILLGKRSELSSEIKEDFRSTSSSHLLAISGLHITQIIGFLVVLFRVVGLSKRASRRILIPLLFVLFFLAGAGISVFRASVMMLFVFVSSLFRRRGDSVTALVAAACLAVLYSPYSLLDPSFLFSFSSTFAILVCVSPICEAFSFRLLAMKTGPKKHLAFGAFSVFSAFLIGSAVFVFNLPIQLLFFRSVSLFAPLYSLLFIPVFGICLLLALFLAALAFLPFSVPAFPQFCKGALLIFLDWVSAFSDAALPPIEFSSFAASALASILLLLFVLLFVFRTKIIRIYQLYFALLALFLTIAFFS